MRTVLVTGFTPFRGHKVNCSGEMARQVDGLVVGGWRVAGRVLPTEFRRCEVALARAVRETKPAAMILFGLSRRKKLSLEVMALNIDHSIVPDNAGAKRWRQPIRRGGPMILESTLPLERLHGALKKSRMPVEISHHAGTYVCNHAFYVARMMARRRPTGFVHVPAAMDSGRLARVLRVILKNLD